MAADLHRSSQRRLWILGSGEAEEEVGYAQAGFAEGIKSA